MLEVILSESSIAQEHRGHTVDHQVRDSQRGVPIFPPTKTFFPEFFKISPSRLTVVVFPFEPVIAINLWSESSL